MTNAEEALVNSKNMYGKDVTRILQIAAASKEDAMAIKKAVNIDTINGEISARGLPNAVMLSTTRLSTENVSMDCVRDRVHETRHVH